MSMDRLGRKWVRRVLVVMCDQCNSRYEITGSNIARRAAQQSHFCSKECRRSSRKSGLLRDRTAKTCRERYGSDSPLGSQACQQKSKQTCLERYGVEYTGAVPSFIERRKRTCEDKYGTTSYLSTQDCRETLNDPEVQARRCVSINKIDWRERAKKAHATMKKNDSYARSLPEDRFYVALCEQYENVHRQVTVNGWPIDFYIEDLDLYVQFDGVYWHGLDRPLSEIAKHKTPRDVIIHRKHKTDREQDSWFAQHGLKLVRVTDKQFQFDSRQAMRQLICNS